MRAHESTSIMNDSETNIKKVLKPGVVLNWRHNQQQQTREDQQEEKNEGLESPKAERFREEGHLNTECCIIHSQQ